jgi:hypothetical protein
MLRDLEHCIAEPRLAAGQNIRSNMMRFEKALLGGADPL